MKFDVFAAFANQSNALIAIKNQNSEYLYANQTVANLYGYQRPEDIVERQLRDEHMKCPGAELAEEFYMEDRCVFKTQENLKVLCFVNYANNDIRLLLGEKMPLVDDNQSCIGVGLNYVNVTGLPIIQLPLSLLDDIKYYKNKLRQFTWRIKNNFSDSSLSERECEVLFLYSYGKPAKEIADLFNLSERTIETHLYNIKQKVNCRNKSQLIEYAIENGYLSQIPKSLLFGKNKFVENGQKEEN